VSPIYIDDNALTGLESSTWVARIRGKVPIQGQLETDGPRRDCSGQALNPYALTARRPADRLAGCGYFTGKRGETGFRVHDSAQTSGPARTTSPITVHQF